MIPRRLAIGRLLVLAGCACLLVVVLTHIAECLHLLPGMGWGLPNSPGHYLDLFSAVAGIAFLLAAYIVRGAKSEPDDLRVPVELP
jgi:hypothetical protein